MPDLINPFDGWIASILYGTERIVWPRGWTGYRMERALRERGVRVYGRLTTDSETLALSVRRSQAAWARYIVATALAGRPLPAAWNARRSVRPTSPIAAIVDLLAWLAGN